ncbi:MAG TPA: MBL fold metallo-hydrolase [Gemmatimonadales bacterium]|nr:MBL fold metallo-hydrolase [Gemmatimonadales bacterium]
MGLVHSFQLGSLRCHALEAGIQKLDGGAMFGVVPKPLWERRIKPDERNRIALAMRCLLVEHPDGLVLIDTGLGNKEDSKFMDIYGVENQGKPGPTQLEDALAEAGYKAEEVQYVINTHLHFDHAGGNTWIDQPPAAQGTEPPRLRLSFPNATYHVQSGDLEFARNANERTRASYLPHNWEPVVQAGKFKLLEGDGEVLPGISVRVIPGHVPFLQGVLLESGPDALFYLADLMPTRHHLPLPWIMGYDVEPLRTLESKRELVHQALAGNWRLFFEHDAEVVMGRLAGQEKKVELVDTVAC